MSKQIITAIRVNVDCLKKASVMRKSEIAEGVLEGMLALITDFENRLSALENKNG